MPCTDPHGSCGPIQPSETSWYLHGSRDRHARAVGKANGASLGGAADPAVAPAAIDVGRNDVDAGFQHARLDRVSRAAGEGRGAEIRAVQPGLVFLVDRTEIERRIGIRRLGGRERHGRAHPDLTDEAVRVGAVPQRPRAERRRRGLPRRVVVGRQPRPAIMRPSPSPTPIPTARPNAASPPPDPCGTDPGGREHRSRSRAPQRGFAHEGAQPRAAIRRVDQADRHIRGLLQLAREVVAGGRETADRLGTGDHPAHTAREVRRGVTLASAGR